MTKILVVSTFVLVAILMGTNIISPASGEKPGDMYWVQEQCDEKNRCAAFVDVDGDGACNLLIDKGVIVPRALAEKLPVFEGNCGIVF